MKNQNQNQKLKQLKINSFLSFFSFLKLSLLLICFDIALFRFANQVIFPALPAQHVVVNSLIILCLSRFSVLCCWGRSCGTTSTCRSRLSCDWG